MASHAKDNTLPRGKTSAKRANGRVPSDDGGRSRERADVPFLYPTKNSLPEDVRSQVVPMLNQRLADCIDLQSQCKQAHWNVKGPSFIGLHELFDQINEAVEEYVDRIAERVVQLGGIAEGTAAVVATRTSPALPAACGLLWPTWRTGRRFKGCSRASRRSITYSFRPGNSGPTARTCSLRSRAAWTNGSGSSRRICTASDSKTRQHWVDAPDRVEHVVANGALAGSRALLDSPEPARARPARNGGRVGRESR